MAVKLVVDRDAKTVSAEPAKRTEVVRLKNKIEIKMISEGKRWTVQARKK